MIEVGEIGIGGAQIDRMREIGAGFVIAGVAQQRRTASFDLTECYTNRVQASQFFSAVGVKRTHL